MNNDLENKKQYFKDSVYLKYENLKNSESTESKFENRSKKMNKLQKVAAVIIVGTMSLTAYAGITGNITLENMGFMKMSEKYEESLVSINKSIENEYCNITIENMAGDSAYVIAEYKISLKEKALKELPQVEYTDSYGYNLGVNKKIIVNSKEITNVMEYVDKISENEYSYIQVINVMDINSNDLDLEIDLDNVYIGQLLDFSQEDNNIIDIGKTIKTKVQLQNNIQNNIISERSLDNNTKIIVEKIANTKFQTFIKMKKITENVTMEEYNNNPMQYISFLITEKDETQIPSAVYSGDVAGKKIYMRENGKLLEKTSYEIKNTDNIKVEEDYIILLGLEKDIDSVKISITQNRIYNDRTNEEEDMYNKAQWYKIENGGNKYSAQSGLGGILEIQKIETTKDNISFYYEEKGIIGNEWKVIIRENNGIMNYAHPTKEEHRGLDSKENKITFSRKQLSAGLNLDRISLDNLDNIEFTLLFGCITEKVGEPINVDVPKLNAETAKINELEIINK